ncbi:acyl-CoA dehydrogenase family protein [Sphingomonadaceae bacterium jetA1]|jgi:alkylation response protein AidB-like acyl-CoA dehydrogenase|uniref:acyl-CoA dehydrogenase family protein n=1 Tax=Facivitalis istanbulensis TaxID=3075838 RepID=UPI0034911BE5
MKLAYSAADLAFRQEIRRFLHDNLPLELAAAEARHSHLRRDKTDAWQRVLARQGWAVPNWPESAGGPGWTPVQRHMWDIEYGRANAPEYNVIGVGMVGPVIAAFGDEAQKRHFLGRIITGDLHFCQGFSEPGAGSDLASLKTRAVRDGDDYVITGQKTWTSHAADADYMICLARTRFEGKPQTGLSMLLVPMDAPGITVRPIPTIDGIESVNEVFLDAVRVPAQALIGEQDKGWTYAKFLLTAERTHNAYLGMLHRYLDRLRALKGMNEAFRRKVAMLAVDVEALEWSVLRVHARDDEALGGATASALKVTASDLLLRASSMEVDALGMAAMVEPRGGDDALALWMRREAEGKVSQLVYWRAASIFGGTNEIQRTIIWSALAR